ncbi:MAG: hypothetical protein M2R45_01092 [Verrucomicrobia subdivision 3 bacterium]|nr:hypothetical protein [Limisphaerales bacterium]MCS1414203.1 hypothetical protein [Limisphaerales bacterium]
MWKQIKVLLESQPVEIVADANETGKVDRVFGAAPSVVLCGGVLDCTLVVIPFRLTRWLRRRCHVADEWS